MGNIIEEERVGKIIDWMEGGGGMLNQFNDCKIDDLNFIKKSDVSDDERKKIQSDFEKIERMMIEINDKLPQLSDLNGNKEKLENFQELLKEVLDTTWTLKEMFKQYLSERELRF